MSDEEKCTWIALEAATRNVTALLCIRSKKEDVPAAGGALTLATAGTLTTEDAAHIGDKLVKRA